MDLSFGLSQLNGTVGFVLYKVFFDAHRIAVDYAIVEANAAFFSLTGFKTEIIGQPIIQTFQERRDEFHSCLGNYESVLSTGEEVILEKFSENLKCWYYLHVSVPEEGYFVCVLTPEEKGVTPIESDTKLKLRFYRNESLIRIMSTHIVDMTTFLDYALSEAIKLTASDIGYIYLYNAQREEFVLNSWSDKVMDSCKITEKQTIYQLCDIGFWGEVIRQKKAIINNNFMKAHPLKRGMPEGHAPLHRFMSLPIYDKGIIVAVIGLANKQTDYDEMDIKQIQLFMEDVWMASKRVQAENELQHEKEQLNAIIESVNDGLISIDAQHRITKMNTYAQQILMQSFDTLKFENIIDVITSFSYDAKVYLETALYNELPEGDLHGIVIDKNENFYQLRLNHMNAVQYENSGFILVLRDITNEQKHTQEVEFMGYHDALTGLYNRRFYEEEISRLDNDRNYPLSIIIGDVNGLKLTNDAFGHKEGDALLVTISKILQSACRKGDIIARWGGDEFIFLLPNTSTHRANAICKNIKSLCEKHQGHLVNVSISLGTSTKTDSSEEIYKTLSLAEDIMYKNKLSEGKSQRSNIIEAIKKSLFAKNHETEEHADRVLQYSILMAEKLGLSEDETSEMKLLAILHDVGKIGISDNILLKPSSLNDEEWYEMKKHSVIGYRIALASSDLQNIALNILHHHENWDGSGYPDGLKGEKIPLLARILSIADAYDAMTSDRPYRKAMSKEEAISELKSKAGSQFDKSIVSVFTKYIG